MSRSAPTDRALTTFGADRTDLRPLPGGDPSGDRGGDEVSLLSGRIVLKQVGDSPVARWGQALIAAAPHVAAFRLPQPIASGDGRWEVDGWIATEFVEGLESLSPDPGRIIRVGYELSEVLTATLRAEAPPNAKTLVSHASPVLQRRDRWAEADRFVWGEAEIKFHPEESELALTIRKHMVAQGPAGSEPAAVVHGDLSGNVFLDPTGTPVVLDFSPFIRPSRYGAAIVVADNLLWHDGDTALISLIDGDEDGLARALLFRLATDHLAASTSEHVHSGVDLGFYRQALDRLRWH